MTDILPLLQKANNLLAQRCNAHRNWETSFRKVLTATSTQQQPQQQHQDPADTAAASSTPPSSSSSSSSPTAEFQNVTQNVGQIISAVSVGLKGLVAQVTEAAAASSSSSTIATKFSRWIDTIQQNEKKKFETTIQMQKLLMTHMRGEGCASFVHEHDCAVYELCFGFTSGTALAKVTASASMMVRRRLESSEQEQQEQQRQQHARGTIPVSDDDEETAASAAADQQQPAQDCAATSEQIVALLELIRGCEENISDASLEIQAAISDSE